ncbi:MAG TPA: hypothetical protein VE173_13275, partial [Longimicrobiales bacterium]|nr:hypothetical protein [Longimicrobiales bacterium]
MRTISRLLAALAVLSFPFPTMLHAQRKPLSVAPLTRIEHKPTGTRLRFDPNKGRLTRYDVEGRIEYLPESRDFLISWAKGDGSRERVHYELPNKVSAIVAATVSFDSSRGLYTYSYTITNGATSTQRLQWLFLEAASVDHAMGPDQSWLSEALTPHLTSELGISGWSWIQVAATLGILPGHEVEGFRIVSRAPPGVVRCYVRGMVPLMRVSEEIPEELHAAIDRVAFT